MIPHCDKSTGKIYGCEKYSWRYYHEEGHLKFNDEKSQLILLQSLIFDFWIISITLSVLNPYMLFISLPTALFYVGVNIYEEKWANKYANLKIGAKNGEKWIYKN